MATEGMDPEMDSPALHRPVMAAEALRHLDPRRDGVFLDATLGEGGHAAAILESSSPTGRVFGVDLDPRTLAFARQRLSPYGRRFDCVQGNYADMLSLAQAHGFVRVDGLIMDLGFSSRQVQQPGYGFSFLLDEPLDMRFDPDGPLTASYIVNEYPRDDLADILHRFGEERRARPIARAIVAARPIQGTLHLSEIVSKGARIIPGKIHPATRTFQALRIAVNAEIDGLESGLKQAVKSLKPGGRLAVISYHSLEDRMVKSTFARESKDCICPPRIPMCVCGHSASVRLVNKRVVVPSQAEGQSNPRSRSARLRVAERVENAPSS